jgi:hypothetical protein
MAQLIQYDFFEQKEKTELKHLIEKCDETQEMAHKIRKSYFASKSEMMKVLLDVSGRLEVIEKHICKG